MAGPAPLPPMMWLPAKMAVDGFAAAYLPSPDAFIGKTETGQAALYVVTEDDFREWVDPLSEGELVEFRGVRFFDEDNLIIRADGTWSTTVPQPAGSDWVEYDLSLGDETVSGLAAKIFRMRGPGSYGIAYLSETRATFVFRDGRFEPTGRQE
jgi:hypothetical protein